MRNKYEELQMFDDPMTEAVTVNSITNTTTNNNTYISNSNNNNGFSVAIEESTPAFTEESDELSPEESVAESLSSTLRTKVGSDKDKTDEENDKEAEEDDEDLKSKYVKLIEHNSKLVDLLKTTMQIQTDMFRKLIHYVFP